MHIHIQDVQGRQTVMLCATREVQLGNWLQKADFSSCSQLSRLNYGRVFSIVASQGGEIGRFNLNNSHENKTIWGLALLNIEIHHYFKQLDILSSPHLPKKLRRRVTIYSFSAKFFVAKRKYKSWEVRRRLCILSECFSFEVTSLDCRILNPDHTWLSSQQCKALGVLKWFPRSIP